MWSLKQCLVIFLLHVRNETLLIKDYCKAKKKKTGNLERLTPIDFPNSTDTGDSFLQKKKTNTLTTNTFDETVYLIKKKEREDKSADVNNLISFFHTINK